MKLTNRHLAFIGLALGGVGLAFEWRNLFPSGLQNPLTHRPIGTTPADGRRAVQATQSTAGRPSPYGTTSRAAGAGAPGGRASSGSTLTLGSALTPIAGFLGGLLSRGGASSPSSSNKPDRSSGGGGGGAPSSPGGSAGRVDAGRGAPFGNDNTSNAGGTGPTQSSPYADANGFVAYPQGDGTYQDDNGNQVYISDDGSITYDPSAAVGYVDGSEVFPNSFDPNDPSTFDFYGDGGPLADPDSLSAAVGSGDGSMLLDPASDYSSFNDSSDAAAGADAGFTDTGVSDVGADFGGDSGYDGGGDGTAVYDDNASFDGF